MSPPVRSLHLHYGWIVVGLTFVTLPVAEGAAS